MTFDRPELRLAAALAVGLLIGAERERRKGKGPGRMPAGVRTFALVALIGGVAHALGTAVVVTLGVAVAAAALLAYAIGDRKDPGLTSEVALVLTYALGALAQTAPGLAIGTALVAVSILAFRRRLHGLATDLLTTREMLDALIFAVCALVILPLLPNQSVGPFGALNPFVLWRLVVLVMGITGLGYIAQRFVGARFGLAVAGFASGVVSSTATIHAMGTRARAKPEIEGVAVAGAVASSVATFVQLFILVGAASPALVVRVAPALGAGGGVALVYAAFVVWRAARAEAPQLPRGRAFRLRTALAFAAIVATIMLFTQVVERELGAAGAMLAYGVAGLADAHAAAASAASLHAAGAIDSRGAVLAVLIALSTNTASKAVVALLAGTRRFALRVQVGLAAMLAAAWIAFAVSTWAV